MKVFRRILNLCVRPDAEWTLIAAERASPRDLMLNWIVPFSLIAPVTISLGAIHFDHAWNAAIGYTIAPAQIVPAAFAAFLLSVLAVFVLAGIFRLLAPVFGGQARFLQALEVAVFGAVPVWVSALLLFLLPMIVVTLFAFFFSCYQFSVGANRILRVNEERALEFVAISMVALSLALMGIGAAAGAAGLL